MEKQIHAHQVLAILDGQTSAMTIDEFRATVTASFGSDAVYTNCHDDAFSFDQLLQFMQARNKVAIVGDIISIQKANVCAH